MNPYIPWSCQHNHNKIKHSKIAQIAKILGSTSVRHRSDTVVSDRCLIDVDPSVFVIWDCACDMVYTEDRRSFFRSHTPHTSHLLTNLPQISMVVVDALSHDQVWYNIHCTEHIHTIQASREWGKHDIIVLTVFLRTVCSGFVVLLRSLILGGGMFIYLYYSGLLQQSYDCPSVHEVARRDIGKFS